MTFQEQGRRCYPMGLSNRLPREKQESNLWDYSEGWQSCLFSSQQQLWTSTLLSESHRWAENRGTEVTEYSFSLGAETAAHKRAAGSIFNLRTHEAQLCFPYTSLSCLHIHGNRIQSFLTGVLRGFLKSDCGCTRRTSGFPTLLHQTPTWHLSPPPPWQKPDWEPLWEMDKTKS